ncbi:hypothetical protein Thiowin_03026 [Thiorhodovibrio winogradskyi]|uniref:Uncharacterized protein n=1 Tax=Thiorhodovibrio winogradskyi TaxID=77007 RepID=A0ABZ0SAC4_9GAMM|nr:hypothetical protein [Thiorhodovibrio winogradskyi]
METTAQYFLRSTIFGAFCVSTIIVSAGDLVVVLFCGLTRTTVHLDVVCAESNPTVQERIFPLA